MAATVQVEWRCYREDVVRGDRRRRHDVRFGAGPSLSAHDEKHGVLLQLAAVW
ncbi:hypothetical protein [Stigmatella aurantiaca]|uniref:hypothetical protein n=1 Tax=Stigmatella aurantiaca TaxID=41 RepID=UPI0015A594E5|nr:hypothetical protein [Stigmatella aurantiaca]